MTTQAKPITPTQAAIIEALRVQRQIIDSRLKALNERIQADHAHIAEVAAKLAKSCLHSISYFEHGTIAADLRSAETDTVHWNTLKEQARILDAQAYTVAGLDGVNSPYSTIGVTEYQFKDGSSYVVKDGAL